MNYHGRAMSPVGHLVFKTSAVPMRRRVGSTPTSSANKVRPPSPPSGGFDAARYARSNGERWGGNVPLVPPARAAFPCGGPAESCGLKVV